MKPVIVVLSLLASVAGCSRDEPGEAGADVDALVEEYLFLELGMARHDTAHVDAYFGPEDIREAADEAGLSLEEIRSRARGLKTRFETLANAAADPLQKMRFTGLVGRLTALDTRIALNEGEQMPFDRESRLLFGAVAPDRDADYFKDVLDEIDGLLPGDGGLAERVAAFRNRFVIPPERLPAVFDAAMAECRSRTLRQIELAEDESFTIEYVNDKPWSGYNWYQGGSQSLIQVNTDLPIFISRAVDLGCHEGYPGHHTFNALLEENLVEERGWLEFSLYPLFSPQSLIAEGSGNYGIELAFPGDERIAFEREVLFPLAGLDATEADRYYALQKMLAKLDYAGNEAARDYLNGTISRRDAVDWLVDYTLASPERAEQRVDFFDTYRSYVINYNLGKDIVRDYAERGNASVGERWNRFEKLLASPMTAADLEANAAGNAR